jgi:glycerol-3-phosphate acyltransferase PlsX
VGLLSIGSEDAKGNELVKETRDLFIEAPLNYVGHVEGTDVMGGVAADVIVCEGFVGNVVLKVCEGLSENLHSRFEEIIGAHVETTKDSKFTQLIGEFRKATDYAEIGGAPLLGVNGTCLIAHGRSDARAIGNGLLLADRFVRARVVETIAEGMKALQSSE